MLSVKHLGISLAVVAAAAVAVVAQTIEQPEEFTAVAIQNNNLGSGADRVIIRVTRWSTENERAQLAAALQKSPAQLLDDLQDQRSEIGRASCRERVENSGGAEDSGE